MLQVASTPPIAGPIKRPELSVPTMPVICRPRWRCLPTSATIARRAWRHISIAAPPMKRYARSWVKEPARAVRADDNAIKSGPAMRITLRPKRSTRNPLGTAATRPPSACMTITREATPKPVSKDLANTGIAGVAMLPPKAKTNAGKYSVKTCSDELTRSRSSVVGSTIIAIVSQGALSCMNPGGKSTSRQ